MKHRKLRIAWSVAWGIVAVLLVGLWVQSYWWWDAVNSPTSREHHFVYESLRGKLELAIMPHSNEIRRDTWVFVHESLDNVKPGRLVNADGETILDHIGTGWAFSSDHFFTILPHWVFAGLALLLGAAPWFLPERFRVRTLLIATAFVAIALGIFVYRNGRGMR
jgi:hypothetical protein